MITKELNDIIDSRMKDLNIFEYRIEGMKLREGNHSVNEEGDLECDKILDIYIKPISKLEKITVDIVISKTGMEWM